MCIAHLIGKLGDKLFEQRKKPKNHFLIFLLKHPLGLVEADEDRGIYYGKYWIDSKSIDFGLEGVGSNREF